MKKYLAPIVPSLSQNSWAKRTLNESCLGKSLSGNPVAFLSESSSWAHDFWPAGIKMWLRIGNIHMLFQRHFNYYKTERFKWPMLLLEKGMATVDSAKEQTWNYLSSVSFLWREEIMFMGTMIGLWRGRTLTGAVYHIRDSVLRPSGKR